LRLRRHSRRSLELIKGTSPERQSLSALCCGKAALANAHCFTHVRSKLIPFHEISLIFPVSSRTKHALSKKRYSKKQSGFVGKSLMSEEFRITVVRPFGNLTRMILAEAVVANNRSATAVARVNFLIDPSGKEKN
jgi:hypothetical protein